MTRVVFRWLVVPTIVVLGCAPLRWPVAGEGSEDLDRAVAELKAKIQTSIEASRSGRDRTVIAVAEFRSLRGDASDLGRFIAEELITDLAANPEFRLIDRQSLVEAITDSRTGRPGPLDAGGARRLRKALGVDVLVVGMLTDLGKRIRVDARLMNSDTGEIFGSASTDLQKDDSVARLLAPDGDKNSQAGDNAGAGAPPRETFPDSHAGNQPEAGQSSAAHPTAKTVVEKNVVIEFELASCLTAQDTVVCQLNVTNESKGRKKQGMSLQLYGVGGEPGSKLVDIDGKQRMASSVWLGMQHGAVSALLDLPPGVVTKAGIEFDRVGRISNHLKLLRISFGVPYKTYHADFTNVVVQTE